MKKYFLFFICISSLFCFSNVTDSLQSYLKTAAKDTLKVRALIDLSAVYQNNESQKAIDYLKEAIQLSKELKYDNGIVLSLIPLGTIYDQKSSFQTADSCFQLAMTIAQKNNSKKFIAMIYNNLGMLYFNKFDYEKSLQNYFNSYEIFDKLNDSARLTSVINNIANVYYIQKNLDKALSYHLQSLAISRKMGEQSRIASSLNNLGLVYRDKQDYKKAMEYYAEALSIAKEINHKFGQSLLLNNIGKCHRMLKNYKEALKCFTEAMELKKQLGDFNGLAHTYNNLGDLYFDMKQYDEAIEYNLKAIEESKKTNNIGMFQNAYLSLSEVYAVKNNYLQAYNYYKLYTNYKDTLFNTEKSKQIAEMGTKYETELKDKELIKKDAEIKIKETEAKQKETQRNAFIIGFLLIGVLAILIFKNLRDKQKANNKLNEAYKIIEIKNNIVEQKNKDITDSINYAKRIQKALLASDWLLNKGLSEYFILYKPKDIVSGDFYWATAVGDKFYLATCDCTGHGVPGAFMSLLNTSKLNEAINDQKIVEPHLVFNRVRNEIVKALNPDGSDSNTEDGMDAVLCSFDFKQMKLDFVCANNPLWLLRNKQIKEFKPDKMSVGKNEKNDSFSLQTVELQKGDCIYTFSDGYADQFGGEQGKKFKYKQLQEKLLSVSHLPMQEQKQFLDSTIKNWQGNLEQVDDILIVGVRV